MGTLLNFKPRTSDQPAKLQGPCTGIIIQARQTSKRFPGKSLAPLGGKPILQHVIEAAKQIKGNKKYPDPFIIIAVPDTGESEPLLELANSLGVTNSCGSEENVLERYYKTAKFFKLDYIVRLTADCPLLHPKICSEVLQLLQWRKDKCDYVSNSFPEKTFPKGWDCEAFTMDCLEAAYILTKKELEKIEKLNTPSILFDFDPIIKTLKYNQEHVTPWMQLEKTVQRATVKQKKNQSHINLCVDKPSDIPRLERYINKLKQRNIKHKAPLNDN